MKPILYRENETAFTTNGLGRMADAISCKVTEERNGSYELEMVYPVNGKHYSDLAERMILYAIHDDTRDANKGRQPFRIYEITKPMNGLVTIRARHISYDLNKIVVSPFTASSCAAAMVGIAGNSSTTNPFTFWTDKDVTAEFALKVPTTCRSILGGSEGSILDTFGTGEYEWDHWTVKLYLHRGSETDVVIRYGKNLTDLEENCNVGDTYNAVYPFWKGMVDNGSGTSTEQIVYISDDPAARVIRAEVRDENNNVVNLPTEVVPLDLSDQWENPPTQADLRTKAGSYLTRNEPWLEKRNVTVSFIALWQTEEYKNIAPLERLRLCDTVTVVHKKLGVKVRKKIIKVVYDVLSERYISMELGDTSKSFTSSLKSEITKGITEVKKEITPRSVIDSAINHATQLIRGGLGGHVVINTNANGEPNEILIMNKPDIREATNVIRMNESGIAFSNNGYEPDSFVSAWTIDGQFVADFITTGTLNAGLIKAGVLSDNAGKTVLDLASGHLTAKNLLIDTQATGGTFEVKSQNFTVTQQGDITLNNASLQNMTANGSFSTSRVQADRWTYDPTTGERVPTNPRALATSVESGAIYFYKKSGTDTSNVVKPSNLVASIDSTGFAYDGEDGVSRTFSALSFKIQKNTSGNELDAIVFCRPTQASDQMELDYVYVFAINNGANIAGYTEDVFIEAAIINWYMRFAMYDENGKSGGPNGPTIQAGADGSLVVGTNSNQCGFAVWGTKNRIVPTENYGLITMDAMESSVALFSDVGSGTVGDDGSCLIIFDPKFRETIDLTHDYQVFLTPLGITPANLSVEKREEFFTVYGTPGTSFDWIVYARQKDYVYRRLEEMPPTTHKEEPPMSELEALADQYIKDYEREVYSQ